mgnify:CR=1 FL=1
MRRPYLGLILCFVLALAACKPKTMMIYVDATRGCKQTPGNVALWINSGGGVVGGRMVKEVPHGAQVTVLDKTSRYGIVYYLVEYESVRGWLSANYTDTVPPKCE